MEIFWSLAKSETVRSFSDFWTASFISARARRIKRCRLARLLPLGLSRLSIKFDIAPIRAGAIHPPLSCLVHPHVPFDQAAHLASRVMARQHAFDEFVVLRLRVGVLLGLKRDDRQQVFDLAEHPRFDDGA